MCIYGCRISSHVSIVIVLVIIKKLQREHFFLIMISVRTITQILQILADGVQNICANSCNSRLKIMYSRLKKTQKGNANALPLEKFI